MKDCKKCGKSVSEEAAFCMYCGSRFGVVCSNCGREAEEDAVFCSACGTRLVNLQGISAQSTGGKRQMYEEEIQRGMSMGATPVTSSDTTSAPTNTVAQQAEIEKACAEIKGIAEKIYMGVEMGLNKGSVTQKQIDLLARVQNDMFDRYDNGVLGTLENTPFEKLPCYRQLLEYITVTLGAKVITFNGLPRR